MPPILSQDITVRFKLHFLLTVIGAIIGVVVVFVNMRSDVVRMLDTVQKQQVFLENNQHEISDMKVHQTIVDYKLDTILERLPKQR